jgi:hypothetical protein
MERARRIGRFREIIFLKEEEKEDEGEDEKVGMEFRREEPHLNVATFDESLAIFSSLQNDI